MSSSGSLDRLRPVRAEPLFAADMFGRSGELPMVSKYDGSLVTDIQRLRLTSCLVIVAQGVFIISMVRIEYENEDFAIASNRVRYALNKS